MLRRGAGFRFCGVIRGLCQSTSGQVGLELFWADVPVEIVSAAADRPTIKTQKRFSIFGPSKIEISHRGVVSPRYNRLLRTEGPISGMHRFRKVCFKLVMQCLVR